MSETYAASAKSRSGCMHAFMVIMLIVVGFMVVIVGGVAWLSNGLARSEGAAVALKRAADHPAVAAKFGTPLIRGTFASGSYAINTDGTGSANLNLSVSGPKGSGTLKIVGSRTGHIWSYSSIVVEPADGSAELSVR